MLSSHQIVPNPNPGQTGTGDVPEFITVDEFASRLRVSRSMAYNLVRDGEIEAISIGRLLRISRQAYERYVNRKSQADA